MKTISLNGRWALSSNAVKKALKAKVPGDVYRDLLDAKVIKDPFYRDNELDCQWIGESDWSFERDFKASAALLKQSEIRLRCHGLDTLATIYINGKKLADTNNMHRIWEWDIKGYLKSGNNQIKILFKSASKYVTRELKKNPLPYWWQKGSVRGAHYMRKEACNFGWDWGPALVTCGIWRDIEILAWTEGRLEPILVEQAHKAKRVDVKLDFICEDNQRGNQLHYCFKDAKGKVVYEQTEAARKRNQHSFTVKNPELWWPAGMGEQPLYELEVRLLSKNGKLLDSWTRRLGLRTLKLGLHKDKWGESFQFEANGIPFFSKGANWIPDDAILSRMTEAKYRQILEDSKAANMNMLRVWGGGIYENDCFYDICDELGLVIWQDFMFACATYPTYDKDFMANVKAEALDNVQRLRHHACIGLWCGNNELEQGLVSDEWTAHTMSWKDYDRLFEKLLPDLLKKADPQRAYWPGSPHKTIGDREDFLDPRSGDAHLWGVWHMQKPFEWYRACDHRFNSEFGFQSFPEPQTVYAYTDKGDRNVTSQIMEHFQRSGIGNTTIMRYMLDWFRLPTGFENTLWLSQILQGMAIKYACEHWRRSMPRGMGTLYWQLNDCWPGPSWSSVDSEGRWKALHYMARKFFNPLLVSAVEDLETGKVDVHVSSDLLSDESGELQWQICNCDGKTIGSGKQKVSIKANGSHRVKVLNLKKELAAAGAENLLVYFFLKVKGKLVSENLVTFCRPKHLNLLKPKFKLGAKKLSEKKFALSISSTQPALWAWVSLKGKVSYSDNFFHVVPGKKRLIEIETPRDMTLEQFKQKLEIASLFDTWQEN